MMYSLRMRKHFDCINRAIDAGKYLTPSNQNRRFMKKNCIIEYIYNMLKNTYIVAIY
jgi:hypothetical protein